MSSFSTISLEDVDQLLVIENACHSHPWSKKTFTSCIGGRYFGYSLTVDSRLVGFYIGEYVAQEATLMDICVDPKAQGKGYGKALLDHFITHSGQLGAQQLFLEVRAKNISALMLYINQGFIEIGRRTGYYPAEIGYEDAIVMKKTIK